MTFNYHCTKEYKSQALKNNDKISPVRDGNIEEYKDAQQEFQSDNDYIISPHKDEFGKISSPIIQDIYQELFKISMIDSKHQLVNVGD